MDRFFLKSLATEARMLDVVFVPVSRPIYEGMRTGEFKDRPVTIQAKEAKDGIGELLLTVFPSPT